MKVTVTIPKTQEAKEDGKPFTVSVSYREKIDATPARWLLAKSPMHHFVWCKLQIRTHPLCLILVA